MIVKSTPKSRPDSGFSLIELIMTIVVMSIVSVPLSLLIGAHLESVFVSEDEAMAQNLARFEMEKVNNMNYANVTSANSSNYQGYQYDLARTVTYVQGNGASAESLKKITVDVTKSNGTKVIAGLTTYLAKNVAYGI